MRPSTWRGSRSLQGIVGGGPVWSVSQVNYVQWSAVIVTTVRVTVAYSDTFTRHHGCHCNRKPLYWFYLIFYINLIPDIHNKCNKCKANLELESAFDRPMINSCPRKSGQTSSRIDSSREAVSDYPWSQFWYLVCISVRKTSVPTVGGDRQKLRWHLRPKVLPKVFGGNFSTIGS